MRLTVLAAAALLAASLAAHADTVYTYTGQNFTNAYGPYTTSDKVTGSFTVAQPLGDNLSNYSFTPESFSFNDGVQTLTSRNTTGYYIFGFSTDGNGNITQYSVIINGARNAFIQIMAEAGAGSFDEAASGSDGAFNSSAGSFMQQPSVQPTVTPEPSSILLLGTGMLGVAGVLKRRFA